MKKQTIYSSILLAIIVLIGVIAPRGLIQCQKNMLMSKEGVVEIGSGNPYIGGEKRLYEHLKKVSQLYLSSIERSEVGMNELVVEGSPDKAPISMESALLRASNFVISLAGEGDSIGIIIQDFKYLGDQIAVDGKATLYRCTDEEEISYWMIEAGESVIVVDAITGLVVYVDTVVSMEEFLYANDAVYVSEDVSMDEVPYVFGFISTRAQFKMSDGICDLTEDFPVSMVYEQEEKDQTVIYAMLIEGDMKLYIGLEVDRELGRASFDMSFCEKNLLYK